MLRSFGDIDIYDETEDTRTVEAAEFLSHLDWEGGIDGLWGHGGASDFPEELRPLAEAYGKAEDELRQAIDAWANERGVSY